MRTVIMLAALSSLSILSICTQKAIVNAKTPIEISQVNQGKNAPQLLQQGVKLYQSEKASFAVPILQQAVQAFKNDLLSQAQALNYLSLAYQQLGDWTNAKKATTTALNILQRNTFSNNSARLAILAQAWNTQGQLQLNLGDAEKAAASWQEATKIYTEIEDTTGIIGSQINFAQALQASGNYRTAYIKLNDIYLTLQKQPDSIQKATGFLSVGNVLRQLGNLEQNNSKGTNDFKNLTSKQVLIQSLALAKKYSPSETIAQIQISLGNTAEAIAQNYLNLSQANPNDRAKYEPKYFSNRNLALKYYKQADASSQSLLTQAQAQINQLRILTSSGADSGNLSEAQTLWPQIQSNLATLPASRKSIYATINFTQTLKRLSQFRGLNSPTHTQIAQLLATAVQQAKALQDVRAQAYALGNLGGLYEQTGQWQEAQKLTQEALILAEDIQAPDMTYLWQWQLGRILKATNNYEQAQANYGGAVNTLKSLRQDIVAINSDVQFSFRDSVEPVYRQYVELLLTAKGKEPSPENLKEAQKAIESLQLAEIENFFRQGCLDSKRQDINQIDRTAAVIYPIILPDRVDVILKLPNQSSLRHYTTNVSEGTVEATIEKLRAGLAPGDRSIEELTKSNDFMPPAQELYNWLIRPLEGDLKNSEAKTLVFIPDGSLRNIPMAVLHDSKEYLIEKHNIALTPGLQLLPSNPLARGRVKALLAGLAKGSPPLPKVQDEIDGIKSQLDNSTVLLDEEFTTKNFEDKLNQVFSPVIHVATHGQFSSNLEQTYIEVWRDKLQATQLSTLLQARNLQRNNPIELLVFSACETAQGDKRAALGLAGIAVKAGARSTVATLWKVSDDSTNLIMSKFYQEYSKTTVNKAEALRIAQLITLKTPRYKHPFYWAPYVLIGNWL